ncbi:MAG TPA: transposase [Beijerinckiaceae bacterium]|nr:transposase [Beijerinckiaceae bacterium]
MGAQLDVSKEGYAGRLDVLVGPTGRRHRTEAEKARIAAESLAPGAVVSDVARRHGASRWQVYDWRRRFRTGRMSLTEQIVSSPPFVPLALEEGPPSNRIAEVIEIAIGDIVVRAGRDVDEAHLARIFRAIRAAT